MFEPKPEKILKRFKARLLECRLTQLAASETAARFELEDVRELDQEDGWAIQVLIEAGVHLRFHLRGMRKDPTELLSAGDHFAWPWFLGELSGEDLAAAFRVADAYLPELDAVQLEALVMVHQTFRQLFFQRSLLADIAAHLEKFGLQLDLEPGGENQARFLELPAAYASWAESNPWSCDKKVAAVLKKAKKGIQKKADPTAYVLGRLKRALPKALRPEVKL